MESLFFYVQGSGREPYKLTSYGSGENFWIKCSCPAGRNKTLCKHVSFILHGDVTKMVRCEPEDAMSKLQLLSAGSTQYTASGIVIDKNLAKGRREAQEAHYADLLNIEAIEGAYGVELRNMGWHVRVEPLAYPYRGTGLHLHGSYMRGKNRKIYVHPTIALRNITEEFEPEEFDWMKNDLPDIEESEFEAKGEWRQRLKQWIITGEKVKTVRTFERPAPAIMAFMDCARTIPALNA